MQLVDTVPSLKLIPGLIKKSESNTLGRKIDVIFNICSIEEIRV